MIRVTKSYQVPATSCHGKSEPHPCRSYGRTEEEAAMQREGWSRWEVGSPEKSLWAPEGGRE